MITRTYTDGGVTFAWNGEPLGELLLVSGGMVAGVLVYGRAVFDTDDWSGCGVPEHWIEDNVAALCRREDARRVAA